MSVGILLVTHEEIGKQLIGVAEVILKQAMPAAAAISIPADLAPQALGKYADRIRESMQSLDQGDGVLVLTDLCGATPDNLARHFSQQQRAQVVSGINLPMLLRVLNYAHQSLEQLCETAGSGGRKGVQQDRE